jgi:outer membrane lipoprotein-sorting protein
MSVRRKTLRTRAKSWMTWATLAAVSCGCSGAISNRRVVPQAARPVVKDATAPELVEKYDAFARAVNSLKATVEMKPTAGSAYSGVIEEYHEVQGFILAQRPGYVRVIGQAPVVGTNVFDMVSDGETFRIFIPSKHKFIVGPAQIERPAKQPIENLRPQHLLDALFWPEIEPKQTVLFEEFNDEATRYYVLTVLRNGEPAEIARKIWFNRANLEVSRLQTYAGGGKLLADIRYADWQAVPPANATAGPASEAGSGVSFPREITLARPRDDYRLDIQVLKLQLNEAIGVERFHLEQPAGADVVTLGENGEGGVR